MNPQDHTNAVLHPVYDLYHRPGTYDENIIKEVRGYSPLFNGEDARFDGNILDIGGQAGYFAVMCAKRFSLATVHTYEPEEHNVHMIVMNNLKADLDNVYIHAQAVAHRNGTANFYVNQGKPNSPCINTGLHTLRPTRGRPTQKVETVNVKDVLAKTHPDYIKCDIEGGEYYIKETLADLPSYVNGIAIEMHLTGKTRGADNRLLGAGLWNALVDQFPNVIKGPRELDLASKNWTATLIATR